MKNKKPNILVIVTDDQRYNTINALGCDEIITPNLDYLVSMGTAFTQAHIPSGTHGAVCMPSRAMLMTGRTLFHLKSDGGTIPEEHKTIGEVLQNEGYFAFGTGKWHNGCPAFSRSFSFGENIFFGGMWDHWNVPTNNYDPTGEYDNVINFTANFQLSNNTMKIHCDKFNPGVHSSELLAETTVKFIENYNEDKPFFSYTAFLAPHDPRTMPEEFKKMYDPEKINLPKSFVNEPEFFGVEKIRDEVLCGYPRSETEIKRHLAEYYAMITHLDSEIGKIISALEAKGILEETIIIFTGDNGLAVGSHGLMGKQNVYDHSVRVPLIFAGKGIPKNKKIDSYVYLLDIFPTICELLGVEIPTSVEGKSFAKMFEDESYKTRDDLFFAYANLIRSVKKDGFKLIEYRNYVRKTQLFDINSDPDEITDLSNDEKYADKIKELRKLIRDYSDEWDDESHNVGKKFWQSGALT